MGAVVGLFVKRETPGERGLPKQPVPDAFGAAAEKVDQLASGS